MPISSTSRSVFSVGDSIRIEVDVTDLSDAAADPTDISLQIKDPDATTATYSYGGGTVAKSATGSYYYDLTVDTPGVYLFRWSATGAFVAAEAGSFTVVADPFA